MKHLKSINENTSYKNKYGIAVIDMADNCIIGFIVEKGGIEGSLYEIVQYYSDDVEFEDIDYVLDQIQIMSPDSEPLEVYALDNFHNKDITLNIQIVPMF